MPGSYRKRGGDSWYLEVCIGTDFRGKPVRYSRTVRGTKKEAEKELARFYTDCEDGNVSKSYGLNVYQMCDSVMEKKIRKNLKQNTVKGYETILERIRETIGAKKANKLRPIDVQEWVNYLSNEYKSDKRCNKASHIGLSPKTVRNTYSFLNMCYDTMIAWGELRTKPTRYVEMPKPEGKEVKSLTLDEVNSFLMHLQNLKTNRLDYKVGALLALFCGLRKGEICGINEEDVNLSEMSINITRTRYISNSGLIYEDTPKSNASSRTVYMPVELAEEIKSLVTYHKKLRLCLGTKWKGSPALLKSASGDSLYPSNIWKWHRDFLDNAGIEHVTFHALRHTYASMLAWMGKDITEISSGLGHSKKTTTLNVYTHMFQDMDGMKRQTADDLSRIIIGKK